MIAYEVEFIYKHIQRNKNNTQPYCISNNTSECDRFLSKWSRCYSDLSIVLPTQICTHTSHVHLKAHICVNLLITTAASGPNHFAEPLRVVGEPRGRPGGPVLGLRQDDRPGPWVRKDIVVDGAWVKECFDLHYLIGRIVYDTDSSRADACWRQPLGEGELHARTDLQLRSDPGDISSAIFRKHAYGLPEVRLC